MALQSLTLSNLAVSFGAKVQDAYVCLSLGSQTLETNVQSTQASRLNWTEDYELCFDSSSPGNKELRIEVCSKHPARRLDPCLAKCVVPIQLGRTTSGAVRQEVTAQLSKASGQYNNGVISFLLHGQDGNNLAATRVVTDSVHHHNVGAVPGYTTGHVEQLGAMNNTYNNYSGTGTKTVYGPANMSNMPMKMANQTNYLSKSGAQGYGATSLGGTQCVGEAVCTRETFQTVEQRPQVREIVRHVREHRPFEKEFVNEVRYVGEREVPERMSTEHLRTEERVVEETVTSPCSPMECGGGCVPVNRGVGMAGASRKANFAAPTMRGAYTGLGATRTAANRPVGAELGNWSTTYTNSYEDPHVGARGVTGKVALNRTMGGGYQQPTYAPGASYAPKISMGRPSTVGPVVRGASQNFSIKAAANGDYINNFGNGDIVCNREFFTMTEDRPIVKEIKDYVRENRVFEKQFVKETRFTGNETMKGISDTVELSNRDSIIEATPAAPPCVGCGCADC
ncbi:MAG: hypothetical protein FRX49_01239 [Trebouxia sp. A1-2]|nr:MAG: hypothetical protein FRX49_01239 [Trebouxia sp. A1-2]